MILSLPIAYDALESDTFSADVIDIDLPHSSINNPSTSLCIDSQSIVSGNEIMTNSTSAVINTISIPYTNLPETD